ncbi:MAG: cupin domain-containing protein [Burkholderiales bacterium]
MTSEKQKIDTAAVARDWAAKGYSCETWIDPPGQVWADFVHDVDELVMPVEGEVEFEVAGQSFRPQLGEEVFIPANAPHTVRTGAGGSRWLYGYRKV